MPHIIVKLYAGKSDELKTHIAEELTKALMAAGNYAEKVVSVSIEEFAPEDWMEKVYKPEIVNKPESLSKKPG